MKTFSITKLEAARKDPKIFAKKLKDGTLDEVYPWGYPKFSRWKDATGEYHKKNDVTKGIAHIEAAFASRKQTKENKEEVARFVHSLVEYDKQIQKKKLELLDRKCRIQLPLNPKVSISGEIPLVFQQKGYLHTYFFSKETYSWRSELKFPIVQGYIADVYEMSVSDVRVGIFSTEDNKFHEETFTTKELASANKELEGIGKEIFNIL